MSNKEIIVLLTNLVYVAIENSQHLDHWKSKSIQDIFQELSNRFPDYNLHLGSLERIPFNETIAVAEMFLKIQLELKPQQI